MAAPGCGQRAVGRYNHVDGGWEISERQPALVPAVVPEIAPFETAQIRLAALGKVGAEEGLRPPEGAFAPNLLHKIHVSNVRVLTSGQSASHRPPPLPQNSSQPQRESEVQCHK